MSKIKNGGLDQDGAGPFEQQQFGTAGVEGVKIYFLLNLSFVVCTFYYYYYIITSSSGSNCSERFRVLCRSR